MPARRRAGCHACPVSSDLVDDLATRPPESVTVTVTRRALPGRDDEMSAWVQAGQRLAAGFEGFLGAGHVRPRGDSDDWHMLYRFSDEAALARWQSSSQREWWLASAVGPGRGDPGREADRHRGLVRRAPRPGGQHPRARRGPPRWKQAVVIFLAFTPVNLAAQALLLPVVGGLPLPLRVLVLSTVLIPVMTWFVLPFVTRRLSWWLEGRPAPWRRRGRGTAGAAPVSVELSLEEFEAAVSDALDQVPPELAGLMDNVVVLVEELPPPEEPQDLLGLYDGTPLTERDSWYAGVLPDRISVFRRPTLAVCDTRDEVVEEVLVTVVHEIAHHFGIDDDRLHELGWA